VQRSLRRDPSALFDGNIFHPARGVITQSEHLLSEALLTLPVRALGGDAVAAHQATIVLSTLLLALTTFALVHWLTRSDFSAFAAGAAALAMPWRLAELAHIQLLSAQWFPLVWLMTVRVAGGETGRRHVALLALALALQLLSSFYLAYYLCASVLLLVLAVWGCCGLSRRALAALALACAPPALLLAGVAWPYVEWGATVGFHGAKPLDSVPIGDAFALLVPHLAFGWRGMPPFPVSYEIPLAVLALGVVGIVAFGRAAPDSATGPRRALVLGLTALVPVAFVLALGREIEVGGHRIPLPGDLAARIVPGYANLRNPLRWAIPIGLAFPILAGAGIARISSAVSAGRVRVLVQAAVAAALAASLPFAVLPVRDAWDGQRERFAAYRALAELPPGPILELPWPLGSPHAADIASRYVQASTLHWRPLIDGVSGYLPPSHELVRQIAQDLPAPRALELLQDLCAVRFIVLHVELYSRASLAPWSEAIAAGRLALVWSDASTWILEVPGSERAGRYQEALASHRPRARTLTGLSRAPLALGPGAGSLGAQVEGPFHFIGDHGVPKLVLVRLRNASDVAWPGLDVQTEGLVRLRYAFRDAEGAAPRSDSVALAEDVPAGTALSLRLPIEPPARAGAYRLELQLVQEQGGALRALPVPSFETPVAVHEVPWLPGRSAGGARGAGSRTGRSTSRGARSAGRRRATHSNRGAAGRARCAPRRGPCARWR